MSGADQKSFTILVIPHSEKPLINARVPLWVLQVLALIATVFWVVLLIFANNYYTMHRQMAELRQLRLVTRQQQAQIQDLVERTKALRENLLYLEELDRQLRELAGIEGDLEADVVPAEATGMLTASRGQAQASVAAATADAEPHSTFVSRVALEDAQRARAVLEQLAQEVDRRRESLETLRVALAERQAMLAARPSIWPVNGIITSYFGYRSSPYGYGRELHQAIDIAAPYGTPVVATGDGTVVFAGWKGGYGKVVIIDHGYGFRTVYGHNSKLVVHVGDEVKRGQIIAYVGSTGRSTGPHLHYEVIVNGRRENPLRYMSRSLH